MGRQRYYPTRDYSPATDFLGRGRRCFIRLRYEVGKNELSATAFSEAGKNPQLQTAVPDRLGHCDATQRRRRSLIHAYGFSRLVICQSGRLA